MKRAAVATGITILLLADFAPEASAREEHRTETVRYIGVGIETDFVVPSWARSVRMSIRDATGRRIGFHVYADEDRNQGFDNYRASCAQRAVLNLRRSTKLIWVGTNLACESPPTTGVVTAVFSSRHATKPSPPRIPARGCQDVGVSSTGIGDGPTCSYTALKPGGYFGAGYWTIQIVRGDRTIELDAVTDPHCSQAGFIHAGDLVTVNGGGGYVAAGDNFRCDQPLGPNGPHLPPS